MSFPSNRSGVSPERPLGEIGEGAGVYPLHQVDEGRVFMRNLKDGKACLVGVLHIPETQMLGSKPDEWPMECTMLARVNSHVWLDLDHAQPFARQLHWPEAAPETQVGDLITSIQWRATNLPDAVHMALRECPIPDPSGGRWAIAFAGLNKPLACMSKDGLYEFAGSGPALVDDRAWNGYAINSVLREPLWGPNGDLGLLTSMRMDIYPQWVKADREQCAQRDERFAQFLELAKDLPELPMVYTRQQRDEHERDVNAIVHAMVAKDLLSEIAANRKPRPR